MSSARHVHVTKSYVTQFERADRRMEEQEEQQEELGCRGVAGVVDRR